MKKWKPLGITACLCLLLVTPCLAKETYVNIANGFSVELPKYDVKMAGKDFVIALDSKSEALCFAGALDTLSSQLLQNKLKGGTFADIYRKVVDYSKKNNGKVLKLNGTEINTFFGIPQEKNNENFHSILENTNYIYSVTKVNNLPALNILMEPTEAKKNNRYRCDIYVVNNKDYTFAVGSGVRAEGKGKLNPSFVKSMKFSQPKPQLKKFAYTDEKANYKLSLPEDWVYAQLNNLTKKKDVLVTVALPMEAGKRLYRAFTADTTVASTFGDVWGLKQEAFLPVDNKASNNQTKKKPPAESTKQTIAKLINAIDEWTLAFSTKEDIKKEEVHYKALNLARRDPTVANTFLRTVVDNMAQQGVKDGIKIELYDSSVKNDVNKNSHYNIEGRISYDNGLIGLKIVSKMVLGEKQRTYIGYFKADGKASLHSAVSPVAAAVNALRINNNT